MNAYTGLGRDELLRIIESLKKERDSYLINLTSVQTRCTELLGSLRNAKMIRDERAQHETRINGQGLVERIKICASCGCADAYDLGRKDERTLRTRERAALQAIADNYAPGDDITAAHLLMVSEALKRPL